jgi:alpha-N-arabinofuranosidase
LFSTNCYGSSVDTWVECDTFNTDRYKGIPYLDVTTVYSEDKKAVYINVVNRHKNNPITVDIFPVTGQFTPTAEATVINDLSLTDPFLFDKQKDYIPEIQEIKTKKDKISFVFPAHSVTQIKAGLNL